MTILKQSTAATIKLGPFVDDTDGKTAETALTIAQADVRLSKNGGANAQKNSATAATHDELGYYTVALSATDTNTLGSLKVMVSKAGALPVWADFLIVTANVYDTVCGSAGFTGVALTSAYDKAKDDVLTPLAAVKTDTAAINAKTTNLPASPAATGAAMTLTSAYDAAKTAATQASVNAIPTTPLLAANYTAPDNAGITTLTSRLTAARAGYMDKLNVTGALANTDNANTFKADVSGLLTAAGYTAPDNAGIAAINAKTTNLPANTATALTAIQADLDNPAQYKADVSGLAKTTDLSGLATEANATTNKNTVVTAINNKPVTPATDLTGIATEVNATANKNAVITAVNDKPVTPATDISGLAEKSDLTNLAEKSDIPTDYATALDLAGIPDDLLSKVIVDTLTVEQVLKVLAAIEVGTVTGGGSANFTYIGKDGTKVTLSGVDEYGNRTAVTVELP